MAFIIDRRGIGRGCQACTPRAVAQGEVSTKAGQLHSEPKAN
jgi:hypothetical protein